MDVASDLLEMSIEYVDSTSYFDEEDADIMARFLDLIKLCVALNGDHTSDVSNKNINIKNLIRKFKKNNFINTAKVVENKNIMNTVENDCLAETTTEELFNASSKENLSNHFDVNENGFPTTACRTQLTKPNENLNRGTIKSNKRKRSCWVERWRYSRKTDGAYDSVVKEIKIWDNTFYRNDLLVSEQNFNKILNLIENKLRKQNTVLRDAISPQEQLAVTLRYLATGETHRMLETQTKLSRSYLSECIPRVCEAIWLNMRDLYMRFPQTECEWTKISEDFEIKTGFPLCVGAVGEKHINYCASSIKSAHYKKYKVVAANSIILLALLDANSRFIYVDVSSNENSMESDSIAQSTLQNILDNGQMFFPQDKVIGNERLLPHIVVADNSFPLNTHVMKPFKHETNSEEFIYNQRFSRAKKPVDIAFDALTARFKIFLKKIELRKVDKVINVTRACCVLHNFFQLDGKCPDTNSNEDGLATDFYNYIQTLRTPEEVREEFMTFFNEEGYYE